MDHATPSASAITYATRQSQALPAAVQVDAEAEPPVVFHIVSPPAPAAQVMADGPAIQDGQRARNNDSFCCACDQACCWIPLSAGAAGPYGDCCGTLVDGGSRLCGYCCAAAIDCGKATCEYCGDAELWECVGQIICCPILMLGES